MSPSDTLRTTCPPLFKYLGPAGALATLQNRSLKYSRPTQFNDEFDVNLNLAIEFNLEEAISPILDKLWDSVYGDGGVTADNALGEFILFARKHFSRNASREGFDAFMSPTIRERLNSMGGNMALLSEKIAAVGARLKVLCLSTNGKSSPMWAHYAQNLSGVALEFAGVPALDSTFFAARPVRYVQQLEPLFGQEQVIDWMSGSLSLPHERIRETFLYTKLDEWAYEHEWRIVAGFGWQPDAVTECIAFQPEELVSIILGTRATTSFKAEIAEIARTQFPKAEIKYLRRSQHGNVLEH